MSLGLGTLKSECIVCGDPCMAGFDICRKLACDKERTRRIEAPEKATKSTFRKVQLAVKEEIATDKERSVKKLRAAKSYGVDVGLFIDAVHELCSSERARDSNIQFKKRSMCYLIMEGHSVPNMTKVAFNALTQRINSACELGLLEDEWFVDTNRKLSHNRGCKDVASTLLNRLSWVELDHWEDQPIIPFIMAEKDGHQNLLSPTTVKWQVSLSTSAGTWSRASLIKTADAIKAFTEQGKSVVVGYVGDADPAGVFTVEQTGIEGALGLRHFLRLRGVKDESWSHERIALTLNQLNALEPKHKKELEVYDSADKDTKQRVYPETYVEGMHLFAEDEQGESKEAGAYIPRYWEEWGIYTANVEVLGIAGMQSAVEDFIKKHIDWDKWNTSVEKSQKVVERWTDRINQWSFEDSAENTDDVLEPSTEVTEVEEAEWHTAVCKHCKEPIGLCVRGGQPISKWLHKVEEQEYTTACAEGGTVAEPEEEDTND
jgi:hypothetical protein